LEVERGGYHEKRMDLSKTCWGEAQSSEKGGGGKRLV